MSTPLPVVFRASPLPSNFRGTPQKLMDAIVERLSIETQEALTLFVTGGVAPTSDSGPWLKDGVTWWVWDEGTGAYIPEILDSKSLRYILSVTEPDHNDYDLWFQLNGYGCGTAVKIYCMGAWKDVYETTFENHPTLSDMTAAIAAAAAILSAEIDTKTTSYTVAAFTEAAQTVSVDGAGHKITVLTGVEADPSSVYNSSSASYTCPVDGEYQITANIQLDNAGGDAPTMEIGLWVGKNGAGVQNTCSAGTSVGSPPGSRWYPDVQGIMHCNAGDSLSLYMSASDNVLSGNVTVSNGDWSVHLTQRV